MDVKHKLQDHHYKLLSPQNLEHPGAILWYHQIGINL